ncbi:BTB/POZ and MATH domain-containing protein 3-like [Aegilops tauschii subsp. strangulata]|uniref:BTB/POZ and MATH domain-containing protein 3-like n=1 Tax=Aegilops tauschii subsp. strangulata TaxID=200361 RepID=UPI001ABD24EE
MAQFEFSFVDETDKQDPARIHDSEIFDLRTCKVKVMKREALEKHLKDDSFTIRCDIVVLNPTCGTSRFVAVPPSDMQQNFTDLLMAGQGTDVVFCVGGRTIAAHRSVLAARSTVFRASLFGPMQEGTSSSVVQIDDMDAAVFKAMLGFIYGDTLYAVKEETNDEDMVLLQHLLVAADK